MAAWAPDMLDNFYLGKNHKFVKNLPTPEARGKVNIDLESSEFYNFIIKRVSWFKSSLLLRIKTVDITNINS